MRVEIWFDYNKDSYETLLNLETALSTFVHAKKTQLFFRSLPKANENYLYHEAFQYGRKKGFGLSYLKVLFDAYFLNSDLFDLFDELVVQFNLGKSDWKTSLQEKSLRNIVLNHLEHATLQKISSAPTLTFSHGFKLFGKQTSESIKETMIKMYEKDTGIEYCEENCER